MKKLILTALLSVSLFASAAEQSDVAKITFMTVGPDYARIKLETMKVVEGCPQQDFYMLDLANDANKPMYSALLSANATKEDIYLLLSGCHLNKPKITHVYLP